jgi:hypothetical protein
MVFEESFLKISKKKERPTKYENSRVSKGKKMTTIVTLAILPTRFNF